MASLPKTEGRQAHLEPDTAGSPAGSQQQARANWRSWATLVLLASLYVVAFIDRTVLALLLGPIKADLGLSDLQLGLLFGTAFGLFYAFAGLPMARVADSRNRKYLIIGGVVFWSCCTILTALAASFSMLAGLRVGLAIGEAALAPAAYSLLIDLFPPRQRLVAMTIFAAAGMGGAAVAFISGAAIIQFVGVILANGFASGWHAWRLVFGFVGLPGLLLAGLLAIVAREPDRQNVSSSETPRVGEIWAYVRSRGWLYFGLFAAAGLGQMAFQGAAAWGPTYMQRVYGLTVSDTGYRFGIALFVAGVGGALTIPAILRRLAEAGQPRLASLVPLVTTAVGGIFAVLTPFAPTPRLFLIAYSIGSFLLIGLCNAIIVSLQYMAPARMRATLTAVVLICISSFGLGVGPPFAALIAKLASDQAQPLACGIATDAAVGAVLGSIFAYLASRPFRAALQQGN